MIKRHRFIEYLLLEAQHYADNSRYTNRQSIS